MADSVLDRLRDRLAVNAPYAGLVAQGYDAWIPVDDIGPDDAVYLSILDRIEGTALELGCGTGRPLLHWLALGHDVEGIDASADMLTILRGHAAERALEAVVHLGDIAPLTLGRRYDALFCPAGTFTLIDDPERAREAVASWFEHLDPGGHLALTLGIPTEDFDEQMQWRVRRTGTTSDGNDDRRPRSRGLRRRGPTPGDLQPDRGLRRERSARPDLAASHPSAVVDAGTARRRCSHRSASSTSARSANPTAG